MSLEIILTWEPGNIGWNEKTKTEKYIPNSNDPRIVTTSNITVKVTDKTWNKQQNLTHCLLKKVDCDNMSHLTCTGKYILPDEGKTITLKNIFSFQGDKIFFNFVLND